MSARDVAVGTGQAARDEQDPTRVKAIASLYELALLLEKHPELPLPFELDGGHLSINFLFGNEDPKAELLAAARAIPGRLRKRVWGGSTTSYYTLDGLIGSIKIELTAFREAVCERVVTGTREVTEEVPDPEKLAEVPKVTVTTTVEDVEWVCGPLLRDQVSS